MTFYRVVVREHEVSYQYPHPPVTVHGRTHVYPVKGRSRDIGGLSPDDAIRKAVRLAHVEDSIPPYRHLIEQSIHHATAEALPEYSPKALRLHNKKQKEEGT